MLFFILLLLLCLKNWRIKKQTRNSYYFFARFLLNGKISISFNCIINIYFFSAVLCPDIWLKFDIHFVSSMNINEAKTNRQYYNKCIHQKCFGKWCWRFSVETFELKMKFRRIRRRLYYISITIFMSLGILSDSILKQDTRGWILRFLSYEIYGQPHIALRSKSFVLQNHTNSVTTRGESKNSDFWVT